MAFPRGLAIAEVTWTQPENKNYDNFVKRLKHHMKRFDAMGINYAKHDIELL
jgi:hexosaminidase